jgi:hypothetical protein
MSPGYAVPSLVSGVSVLHEAGGPRPIGRQLPGRHLFDDHPQSVRCLDRGVLRAAFVPEVSVLAEQDISEQPTCCRANVPLYRLRLPDISLRSEP